MRIVFDNEDHKLAVLYGIPVVCDLFFANHGQDRQRRRLTWESDGSGRRRTPALEDRVDQQQNSVNVLPCLGSLVSLISPPKRVADSRLIARRISVPPYLRLVPASACWKASKISFCFSGAMPMPVSEIARAITVCDRLNTGCSVRPSFRCNPDIHRHLPVRRELEGVRQEIFEDLLQTFGVGRKRARQSALELQMERQILLFGDVLEVALGLSRSALNVISSASTVTVPDSIFDRSRCR